MSLTNEDKEWLLQQFAARSAIEALPTHADLESLADKTREQIERAETNLLTAFHQWASPVERRLRSHSEAIRALDQETETSIETARKIADHEARIRRLEKAS